MSTVQKRLTRLAVEVGEVTGPDAVAEQLIALAHDNRDRDVWGGDRAITYWDRLPDRIRGACYAGPTLGHWWERVSVTLGCEPPRKREDRELLAAAIAGGDDQAVLEAIRRSTETLCLRVRLSHEFDRDQSVSKPKSDDAQEAML